MEGAIAELGEGALYLARRSCERFGDNLKRQGPAVVALDSEAREQVQAAALYERVLAHTGGRRSACCRGGGYYVQAEVQA